MRAIKFVYAILACLIPSTNLFAQSSLWSKAGTFSYDSYTATVKGTVPAKFVLSKIDLLQLNNVLKSAPVEHPGGSFTKGIPFSIVLPDETLLSVLITESPIWEDKYAAGFSKIKTFILSDPLSHSSRGRIALTKEGISGILFTRNGDVYINPVNLDEPGTHLLYFTKDAKEPLPLCGVNNGTDLAPAINRPANIAAADCGRRTYRLAVAATAEYTAWAGGQVNALTYITIAINNVIAVYDRDLNIRFTIISPNSILFTNSSTDPYPGGNAYLNDAATNANQTALDNIIGSANYDVGIVFNNGWNRGYVPPPFAYVCTAGSKGKGAAGTNSGQGLNPTAGPQGLAFDFTVIHELGHMFGAPHSYASNTGFCSGFSTAAAAFEPGSGSTVMGYAGYPTCNTYTSYGEAYFHAGTIAQIQAYINGPGNCVQPVSMGNTAPVISIASTLYNLPVSTPFTLTGAAIDAEGDNIIYTWEQMDADFLTASPPAATNTAGPNFRSYPPTPTGNVRSFPALNDIAAGVSPPYEVLTAVSRTMHFQLTTRDQSVLGGCTAAADVAVNFNSSSGPFRVTSQPSATTWIAGSSQTITWDVAATNAVPINCTTVNILFSTDGGITYPYTLLGNTNNDGTQTITAPNVSTTTGRIMVQAANNIFFNINAANIIIASSCAANGTTFAPADSIAAVAGSALLNLSLSPQYGTAFTPSGTITTANPSTFLSIYNTSVSQCASYGFNGSYLFNAHPFIVTTAGTYTFTPANYGLIYNLYRESFDAAFPCNNFIASNCVTGLTPTTINSFVSAYLLPGRYVIVAGTFSDTYPALPFNYSVAVTGGTIYRNTPNPGATFSYFYVVVDRATNLIKSIAGAASLSNSTAYPGSSSYTIYGLSYSNASPSLSSFVGTNFNTLSTALLNNTAYCGNISRNSATVVVLTQYIFNGNGNWNVAANWSNNAIPPSPLPQYAAISINPAGAGECILNVPMRISRGGQLIVEPGKKFRVAGNLTISD